VWGKYGLIPGVLGMSQERRRGRKIIKATNRIGRPSFPPNEKRIGGRPNYKLISVREVFARVRMKVTEDVDKDATLAASRAGSDKQANLHNKSNERLRLIGQP